MRERDALDDQLKAISRIEQELEDQLTLIELGEAEKDDKTISEAEAALKRLKAEVARRELEALLSGEADANDCYLEVHAGAGCARSSCIAKSTSHESKTVPLLRQWNLICARKLRIWSRKSSSQCGC